jgi:hypothetical protein
MEAPKPTIIAILALYYLLNINHILPDIAFLHRAPLKTLP